MAYKKTTVREITKEKGFYNTVLNENNRACVVGIIDSDFEYSHEIFGEKFYRTRIRAMRLSGTEDYIPVIVSNFLIEKEKIKTLKNKMVEVKGKFKSYNRWDANGKSHLDLFLFVTEIEIYDNKDEFEKFKDTNSIYLKGYICKQPIYRQTPLGKRITELYIAVNGRYGKSVYIPCIIWGLKAAWASKLKIGAQIELHGRIQSREYFKRFSPDSDEGEYRMTYEVSIMTIQKIES